MHSRSGIIITCDISEFIVVAGLRVASLLKTEGESSADFLSKSRTGKRQKYGGMPEQAGAGEENAG